MPHAGCSGAGHSIPGPLPAVCVTEFAAFVCGTAGVQEPWEAGLSCPVSTRSGGGAWTQGRHIVHGWTGDLCPEALGVAWARPLTCGAFSRPTGDGALRVGEDGGATTPP